MWLSDYFLKKYVTEQQQNYYENSPIKEQEPQSTTAKQKAVHNEIEEMNKVAQEKRKKEEFIPEGINQEKFKKLNEDIKETKDIYINYLNSVSTKDKSHSQGKSHGMSR